MLGLTTQTFDSEVANYKGALRMNKELLVKNTFPYYSLLTSQKGNTKILKIFSTHHSLVQYLVLNYLACTYKQGIVSLA